MWNNDDPLLRLGHLIFKLDMSTGVLATAIEQHGIYSWDRYGRFKHFGPSSEVAQKALDQLAGLHAARIAAELDGDYDGPDWEMFSDGGGDFYCWPSSAAPDFEALQGGVSREPSAQRHITAGQVKSTNAHAGIILGLLRFIKGEFQGINAHPDFVSEAQLRELLDSQMLGYPGCSADNTKRKFKAANDLLPKRTSSGT